jgi:hypothetical protein
VNTLLLTTDTWDITLDVNNNLAIATGPYAIAQDVASACRTFLGEVWYNINLGMPYLQQIFTLQTSINYVKQALIANGMTVPSVATITCFLTGPGKPRNLGGQLQIKDNLGNIIAITETTNLAGDAPWWVGAASYSAMGAMS